MIEERWSSSSEQYPDAVRPDAEFVRFLSDEEYDEITLTCLQDQDIPAVLDEHGWSFTVPIGEEQKYDLALFVCDSMYPIDPSGSQPLTPEEYRYLYEYFVGPLTACLAERGYIGEPAPGFDEFQQGWSTDDPLWSPYRGIEWTDPDDILATQEACPPTPAEFRP